jgi:hypothetical protein
MARKTSTFEAIPAWIAIAAVAIVETHMLPPPK